jgi:hypothetical protein
MRRIELTTVRIVFALALGLPAAGAFAACSPTAPTQDEIKVQFRDVVADAETCDPKEVNPCVLVFPGCPLGQYVPVNRNKAAAVDEAARALLRQYALDDQACAYEVTDVTVPEVECREDGYCWVADGSAPGEVDGGE